MCIAALQFAASRLLASGTPRPLKEMWIAILVIVGVYLVIYAFELSWNVVAVSPVMLDQRGHQERDEMAETIRQLKAERDQLDQRLTEPKITPQEERRRQHVRGKLHDFTMDERHVVRHILDHGEISLSVLMRLAVDPKAIQNARRKGRESGLLIERMDQMAGERWLSVKLEFQAALEFVLAEQSS